jgi:hypothetical protein
MTLRGGLRVERPPWLTVHQIIGALILLNAGLVLVPLGGELLDAAPKIIQGKGSSRPLRRSPHERGCSALPAWVWPSSPSSSPC